MPLERMIFPVAVTLNRRLAPLWVFSFCFDTALSALPFLLTLLLLERIQHHRHCAAFETRRLLDRPVRPEHVREWWGRLGDGYSVPVCEVDLRPGGRWRFVNRHANGEAAFHGVYRELDPPARDAMLAIVYVSFAIVPWAMVLARSSG